MRLAAIALFLAFLVPLAAASAQEATLEGLLDLMEKRAEGLRDLSFRVDSRAERNMGMPRSEVTVLYVRGAGLRVRARTEPFGEAMRAGLNTPARADFIYTADRFRLLQEWEEGPESGPLALQALAIRTDDPALRSHDHLLLPTAGYPMRLLLDEPIVYYRIAPRMFFALEPNLAYEGKRTEGGKSWHVLVSTPSPADPKLPRAAFSIETRRKRFFVDPATGAVERLRWELVSRFSAMGPGREQPMTFEIVSAGERKVTETLTVPESVRWSLVQEGRMAGRRTDVLRTVAAVRANAGVAASEILGDAEKDDLYGDAVMRPAAEYEARVKKDPADAEAHFALGQARGRQDPFARMGRGRIGPEKGEAGPALAAFQRAAELRPASKAAAINLMAALRTSGEEGREKAFLERVEKGEVRGERVRLRAAVRLGALGQADRASALLESLAPAREEDRRRVALERLLVAASQGKEEKASSLFAEEAAKRAGTAEKIALVRAIGARAAGLPQWTPERSRALVEKGLKDRPGELAYRIAKAALLRAEGKIAASAAELLEAAPADGEIVDHALDGLDPVRNVVPAPAAEAASPDAEALARLAAALEKVPKGDPRVEFQAGRALAGAGRSVEGRKKYEAALEACRGKVPGTPYHGEALRVALQLGMESGADGWRETCVEVVLEIGKETGSVPYDLLFDETRNPIGLVLAERMGRKEWIPAYRLATAAQRMAGGAYFLWRHRESLTAEGVDAIKKEVYRESAVEKYLELADFLEGLQNNLEVTGVLEKAREKAPKDLELLERLARKYAEAGSPEKRSAFAEILPRLPAERRPALQMDLAKSLLSRKDVAGAKEVLGKIDPKAPDGDQALLLAELWGRAEEWDRAIEACRRAAELGKKPNFEMGRFYEKKKDPYEALRYYNRDRSEGSTESLEREMNKLERSFRSERSGEEEEPTTGEAARARLLKKLGSDWLVKRFLEQKHDPPAAEEAARVRASMARLESDGVDDRDAGVEELRKIGPRAASLLIPLLKSGDEEVKTRVRQLFLEWVEPK